LHPAGRTLRLQQVVQQNPSGKSLIFNRVSTKQGLQHITRT
jgi:hypothetical protein